MFYDAGVAGGAASGKTAVCDMIIQQLHDQRVVLVNQVFNYICLYFSIIKLKKYIKGIIENKQSISFYIRPYMHPVLSMI